MSDQVAITLADVSVRYPKRRGILWRRGGGYWALHDVDLSVPLGHTIGVIGRNGAGKTTLLKVIAGITLPDKGSVTNHGVTCALLSIGLGFASELTGRQNILLSGLLTGMSRARMLELTPQIIEFSELEEFIERPVYTYSTGMRARLGFSISMHTEADVLLIDETLSVGDISFQEKSYQAMQEILASERTIILVSHNLGVIREFCDATLWIEHGRVVAEGPSESVADAYWHYMKGKKSLEEAVASARAAGTTRRPREGPASSRLFLPFM